MHTTLLLVTYTDRPLAPILSMSNFASNLASLARSKLHSALSSGARDNGSLHRWVLLKNSIVRNFSNNSNTSATQIDASDDDFAEEDYTVNSDEYEDLSSFLFPDPGEAASDGVEDINVSEAQWLDSVLEDLGEDDDEGVNNSIDKVPIVQCTNNNQLSPNIVCTYFKANSDIIAPRAIIHYPVPYPPIHPPLVQQYDLDSSTDSGSSSSSPTDDSSFPPSPVDSIPFRGARGFYLSSMPDVIEDFSDDETEAPTTPFSRSRSSLHSVDPTYVPIPNNRARVQSGPRVYSEADDTFFHPFKLDPLPYANNFDHSQFHNPYHQNC